MGNWFSRWFRRAKPVVEGSGEQQPAAAGGGVANAQALPENAASPQAAAPEAHSRDTRSAETPDRAASGTSTAETGTAAGGSRPGPPEGTRGGEPPSANPPGRSTSRRGWLSRPIFLTSTFRDLHAERDWLREHVFPELQERLRGRRVVLEPIDLRLGIDTAAVADEGARELQVLQVCLAEIERSRPFLIGLIGDRYGWVPPAERIQAAADEAGFAGEVAGRSVTELEIAYGVLASPEQQRRSFFYLRQPLPYDQMDPALAADYAETFAPDAGAPEREQKLAALKARLAEQLPDRLRPYRATWTGDTVSGLEAFGEQVLEDLWRELDLETRERLGAPAPTWQESERDALDEFLDWRASGFLGRQAELARLAGHCLGSGDAPARCLTGEAGAGKSALLAALARRLAAAGAALPTAGESALASATPSALPTAAPPLLLIHAAGVSPVSGQTDRMIRRWVGELADALGIREPIDDKSPADDLRQAFHDLLRRMAARRRVVVLIDALDRFVTGSPLAWLPGRLPENVRLLASTLPGAESEACAQAGFAGEALPPLDEAAARELIATLCARHHRTLNARVVQALLDKRLDDGRSACGNPLWLSLAVDELNRLDAADFTRAESDQTIAPAERLTRYLLTLIDGLPAPVAPAYQWLLRRAEALHGVGRCRAFAAPLALARNGLREADLAGLWPTQTGEPWQPLAFAALRRSFRAHVVARGAEGQWDFTHAQMREAALARYLPAEDQRRAGHAELAAHFAGLEADDPLHQSETMVHRIGADDPAGAAALYGGELTDGELAGATAALAGYVLREGEAGAAWVAALGEQPLAPEALGQLGQRFTFDLDDALKERAPLAPRRRLLERGRAIFERLTLVDWNNAYWQRNLSVSHSKIGDLLTAQGDLAGAGAAYDASLAIAKRLAAMDPANTEWQHDLAASHSKIGDLLQAQGDLAGAGAAHRASLAIIERLAASDPGNAGWQRDLSVSHEKIGDLLTAQGDLAGAGAAVRASLAIRERLAASDPGNAGWQRDLSVSHNQIGNLLRAQGDLAGAGAAYRASLAIRERLAASDPGNADWQRGLSLSHLRIGDLLQAQGDLAGAGTAFRASLAIFERLAAMDPANAGWQRDLSVSHNKIGDLLTAQGDLAGAGAAFRASLAIAKRLAAMDPANTEWQHDLAASHSKIGDLLQAQGDLAGAGAAHRASLAIIERLAAADPGNAGWQRDLSVSHNKIGDLLQAQGDLAGAGAAVRASLAIAERLAASDPGNAGWQRDLSVSHNKIGDLLRAQGDLAGAGTAYRASHAILERLAASDPGNAGWQRDLSVSHNKIGDLLQAQGDLAGAGAAVRASLAIRERLSASDPDNADWQRDLSVSHDRIGDLLTAQGDLAGAGAAVRASHAIIERLAASDPGNAGWQRHLSVSHIKIGDLLTAQGDLAGAGAAFRASLAIAERLAASDPGNAGWQRDLSVSHNKIGDLLRAQGDLSGAGAAFRASLAIIERLAASDPGNAEWQRDLWVSYWRLAQAAEASDPGGAMVWWRKAFVQLDGMNRRGIMAPADQQYLDALRQKVGGGSEQDAIALFNLADSHHSQGDLDAAEPLYRQALELDEPFIDFKCLLGLAMLYGERGRDREAQDTFARCVEVCRERLHGATTHYPAYTLAIALLGVGEPEQALAAFEDALRVNASPGAIDAALLDIGVLQRGRSPITGVEEVRQRLRRALPAPPEAPPVDHAVPPAADDAAPPAVGRNDPCPCGSGRKYKHCHGKLA